MSARNVVDVNRLVSDLTAKKDNKIKQIQREFEEELIEALGLKVGDKVRAYFGWSIGSSKQSFHTGGELDGVLVKENGQLLVRSLEMKKKSVSKNNGRYGGRGFREWWEFMDHYPEAKVTHIVFENAEMRRGDPTENLTEDKTYE